MVTKTQRPFTAAEIQLLKKRAAEPVIGSRPWLKNEGRSFFWTILIPSGIVVLGWLSGYLVVSLNVAIVVLVARLASWLKRCLEKRRDRIERTRYLDEIDRGIAISIFCRPARIFEWEEFEDEGATWVFDGGSGRYLLLSGQDFEPTRDFPSSSFEVVVGGVHGDLIAIHSCGPRIPATELINDANAPVSSEERFFLVFDAPRNADRPEILHILDQEGWKVPGKG